MTKVAQPETATIKTQAAYEANKECLQSTLDPNKDGKACEYLPK